MGAIFGRGVGDFVVHSDGPSGGPHPKCATWAPGNHCMHARKHTGIFGLRMPPLSSNEKHLNVTHHLILEG